MNRTLLHEAKEVAASAAQVAGAIIKRRFDTMYKVDEKGDAGDVVTEADYEAEKAIVGAIERKFPDHRILSEEAGQLGQDSDWLWLVDPLDGTNNYVIGLPVFAVSITLLYREEPVLGVIYEPMPDRLYIAVKGEGMTSMASLFECGGMIARCSGRQPAGFRDTLWGMNRRPPNCGRSWISPASGC